MHLSHQCEKSVLLEHKFVVLLASLRKWEAGIGLPKIEMVHKVQTTHEGIVHGSLTAPDQISSGG